MDQSTRRQEGHPSIIEPPNTRRGAWRGLCLLLAVAVAGLLASLSVQRADAGAFVYEGTVLVGNNGNGNVLRIDPASEAVVQVLNHADFSTANFIGDVEVDPQSGTIYVAVDLDLAAGGRGEVVEFDAFGSYVRTIPLPDDGVGDLFVYPFGIGVDSDESIWAARPNSGEIIHVAESGVVLGLYPVGDSPEDVTPGGPSRPGVVYVVNADQSVAPAANPRVDQLDTATGIVTTLAPLSAGVLPLGISMPDLGTIRVTSVGPDAASRVDRLDADTGADVGPTNTPAETQFQDNAAAADGSYFVTDEINNVVAMFSSSGAFLKNLSGGAGRTAVAGPIGVAVAVAPGPSLRYTFEGYMGIACAAQSVTRTLTILNTAEDNVAVNSVSLLGGSDPVFTVDSDPTTPLVLGPHAGAQFLVRFTPTGEPGLRNGTVRITSTDPAQPERLLAVSGTVGAPRINMVVLGSGEGGFGNVAVGDHRDLDLQISNEGNCDLIISDIFRSSGSTDFNRGAVLRFPMIIEAGGHAIVPIRFTPTSIGAQLASFEVDSNDPDVAAQVVNFSGTGVGGTVADLGVPTGLAFPPTVIQQHSAASQSLVAVTLSNQGSAALRINNISLDGTSPEQYRLLGLPPLPITLSPGEIAGAGNLQVAFKPTSVARAIRAKVVVVVADPVSGSDSGSVDVDLCGEGVRPGARLLVLQGGSPAASVNRITLQRFQGGGFHQIAAYSGVAPKTVDPGAPCLPFTYHVEHGSVDTQGSLKFLRPGTYRYVATLKDGTHLVKRFMPFRINGAEFVDGLTVEFP